MNRLKSIVVDLACTSPFYCGALTGSLREAGVEADLASPLLYLEPEYLEGCPRPSWICDIVVKLCRPRRLRLAVRGIEVLINFGRLSRAIRRHQYDVVHVEWTFSVWPFDFMSRLRKCCDRAGSLLVFTAHNAFPHDIDSPDRIALAASIDCAHVIVCHTEQMVRQLQEELGVTAPIEVIPHGPLFADFTLPPREEAATRLGLDAGPIVLFFGLARPYKGLDLLSEAWPQVSIAFPDARLLVVGRALDDVARDHQSAIEALPATMVVDGYVAVKEMLDYYAVSDIVVLPYRAISQSGALMTAVGLGRPTVVTPIEGLIEQTRHIKSAIVSEKVTGIAIAEAVIAGLKIRDELRQVALDDRQVVAESSTGWASVANRTHSLYVSYLARIFSTGT